MPVLRSCHSPRHHPALPAAPGAPGDARYAARPPEQLPHRAPGVDHHLAHRSGAGGGPVPADGPLWLHWQGVRECSSVLVSRDGQTCHAAAQPKAAASLDGGVQGVPGCIRQLLVQKGLFVLLGMEGGFASLSWQCG
jgi:hypothetical protein